MLDRDTAEVCRSFEHICKPFYRIRTGPAQVTEASSTKDDRACKTWKSCDGAEILFMTSSTVLTFFLAFSDFRLALCLLRYHFRMRRTHPRLMPLSDYGPFYVPRLCHHSGGAGRCNDDGQVDRSGSEKSQTECRRCELMLREPQ